MPPFLGFWEHLSRPIMGLAPMDGVTDFACRNIMARYGRPDVIFTEFTTAEGMFYAPERILKDFEYSEIERPIVAQIYGHRPEDFYRATHVVCELGFDGIDINMGCPAKNVTAKNCGAKLITLPSLAGEIIRAVRDAIEDWLKGQTLSDLKVPEAMIRTVASLNERRTKSPQPPFFKGGHGGIFRKRIPYSIKTRIGFDEIIIEKWIETLLQEQPAVISIHGRTLKQMYRGQACWDSIRRAADVIRGSGTLVLGNGDITSLAHATQLIQESGVDGALIGRSAIGNPWIFEKQSRLVSVEEKFNVALEHAAIVSERNFKSVRKHLVGYIHSLPEAAKLRSKALQANSLEELKSILTDGTVV